MRGMLSVTSHSGRIGLRISQALINSAITANSKLSLFIMLFLLCGCI